MEEKEKDNWRERNKDKLKEQRHERWAKKHKDGDADYPDWEEIKVRSAFNIIEEAKKEVGDDPESLLNDEEFIIKFLELEVIDDEYIKVNHCKKDDGDDEDE